MNTWNPAQQGPDEMARLLAASGEAATYRLRILDVVYGEVTQRRARAPYMKLVCGRIMTAYAIFLVRRPVRSSQEPDSRDARRWRSCCDRFAERGAHRACVDFDL